MNCVDRIALEIWRSLRSTRPLDRCHQSVSRSRNIIRATKRDPDQHTFLFWIEKHQFLQGRILEPRQRNRLEPLLLCCVNQIPQYMASIQQDSPICAIVVAPTGSLPDPAEQYHRLDPVGVVGLELGHGGEALAEELERRGVPFERYDDLNDVVGELAARFSDLG
jgi:hypothetical protein